ncbi:MAG: YicC family protein [Deltaproteobacteria bacterium]|nr:MAG: YicC family protein [Deltaproteobacteria bacterium]
MIRSMTGFGRASFEVDGLHFDVEVRSVNHRYLNTRVRLPRLIGSFEAEVRSRIQSRFDRGKIDLSVNTPGGGAPQPQLDVDIEAVRQYVKAAAALQAEAQVEGTLNVNTLLALPGVARFDESEIDVELLRDALFGATDAALDQLDSMRCSEGEALERDLQSRLGRVGELTHSLEGRAGEVQIAVRARLRKRAEQLEQETGLLDSARLHQEVVLAADRLDITEEIVRLRSHVEQFQRFLAGADAGEPVGRRLDFLLQEFGREANTIGSKGCDAPIAHEIIELKAEIERMREQVQNVE